MKKTRFLYSSGGGRKFQMRDLTGKEIGRIIGAEHNQNKLVNNLLSKDMTAVGSSPVLEKTEI